MEVLEVAEDLIQDALTMIAREKFVVIESIPDNTNDSAEAGKAVYLSGYHKAETKTAQRIQSLLAEPKAIRDIDEDKALEWDQNQLSLKLAEKQVEAVKSAANDKVLVITGGPGTGKTTFIKAIKNLPEAA